jgi:hypothetical protein
MQVNLTHSFMWRCPDPDFLLNGCVKFSTFCSRLDRQADETYAASPDETDEQREARVRKINKFRGDGFELFVEAMFRLFPCDKRLALVEDYRVNTDTDVGVDGVGICGFNRKPFTVQCKLRQANYVLSANTDHLTNFTSASLMHFNIDQKPDPETQKLNMMIVTSAESLAFFTDHQMFGQKVFALCRDGIRQLVDNNPTFWKYFAESWRVSVAGLRNHS